MNYKEQRAAHMAAGHEAGLKNGRQQIIDMLTLVLRDPEIMGKDIFGKDRLVKVVNGIYDYLDIYHLAWQKHEETDHMQKQLDRNLAEAYGEQLHDDFHARYPYAPEYDYKKGKWKK